MSTKLSWGFGILSVGFMVVAGIYHYQAGKTDAVLTIDGLDQEYHCPPIEIQSVTLHFHNPSNQPARFISVALGCGLNGCITKSLEPTVILPGESKSIACCQFGIREPGDFDIHSELYFDHNGLQRLPIHIHGTAMAKDN